jgi:hypothetical protein
LKTALLSIVGVKRGMAFVHYLDRILSLSSIKKPLDKGTKRVLRIDNGDEGR